MTYTQSISFKRQRNLWNKRSKQLLLILSLLISNTISASDWMYTVRPGDNLWTLTEKYLKGMKYLPKLQQLNNVKNPRVIPPGTKIKMPLAWLKKQPASARLVHARGTVTIIRAAGKQPESKPPEVYLYIGDRIVTGPDGSTTLEFADKSRLLLQSNSELVMDTLSKYGDSGMVDTQLRMPAGRLDTQVTPRKGPASRYEITTPAAVAAVRGTNFRVSAEHGKSIARSEVLEGSVGVAAENITTEVPAGFGTVTEAGKPPIQPRELLPAPDTGTTKILYKDIPLDFTWSSVSDAQAYRAQIFPKGKVGNLLSDKLVSNATTRLDDLADGEYVLRVRAVDDIGLEGHNRDHAFTVDARPFPPTLLNLIHDKKIRENKPKFEWTEGDGATYYHFQLAQDHEFKEIIADIPKHTKTTINTTEKLPDGRLYWRIASIDKIGQHGPFSAIESFQVRPLPPTPFIHPPVIDKENIYFKWDPVSDHVNYLFQLATDQEFENMDTEHTGNNPMVKLPRPMPETYYYRVKVINASGDAGSFTKVHRIEVPPLNYWPMLLMLIPILL